MFRVQIVDDEPIVRMGLLKLIPWEECGFQVACEAQNGIEALEQLENQKVDLIITDIEMPLMNGIDFIKKVNERKRKPATVILTAYAEFEYAKTAIEYGVVGYILKPIIESQICETLRQVKRNLTIEVEQYYNSDLDNKLIDVVLLTDRNYLFLLDKIIEEEIEYGEIHVNRTCFRFFYILENIIKHIKKRYPNLEKLENLNLYLNIRKEQYLSKEELVLKFREEVIRIFTILERYFLIYKDNIVRQACNYVIEHIDEKIGLASISDALGISKNYFCSLFKQETGDNFLNYVTQMKMQRAKYLLKEKNMRIYEVSNYLGYLDTTYFTKLFKKYVGMTPHEYKKSECENYELLEQKVE